jgi:hypothetical protein
MVTRFPETHQFDVKKIAAMIPNHDSEKNVESMLHHFGQQI